MVQGRGDARLREPPRRLRRGARARAFSGSLASCSGSPTSAATRSARPLLGPASPTPPSMRRSTCWPPRAAAKNQTTWSPSRRAGCSRPGAPSIAGWSTRVGARRRGPGLAARDLDAVAPGRRHACREILDEAARAVGSHPFAVSGPLDRARRDLELFLLQHRLEPALVRRGRLAISERRLLNERLGREYFEELYAGSEDPWSLRDERVRA